MTNNNLSLKKEVLLKEEEKHQLIFIGAIKNLPKVINQTLFLYKSKTLNKIDFLHFFYNEVIKFQEFIEKQKERNKNLRNHIHHVSKFYLRKKRENNDALLDIELKCQNITIGWFYPNEIFDSFYNQFCQSGHPFDNPQSINTFFQEQIDKLYPLHINQYIAYLKEDIASFWEITCSYLKNIVNIVSHHAIFTPQQTNHMALIKDITWSDTYEILRLKIQQDNTLQFKNGIDFRNYILKICNYRIQNLRIKYTTKEISLDTLCDFEQEIPDEEQSVLSLTDIDIHNPYEVAYAIAIILLDPNHPFYSRLTNGIENKVDILIRKVVNGQSYSTIVGEKYNIYPNTENFSKVVAKTRKEYERVRKTLQERFIAIKKGQ